MISVPARSGPAKPEYSRFELAELHSEVGESLGKYLNGTTVLKADFAQDFAGGKLTLTSLTDTVDSYTVAGTATRRNRSDSSWRGTPPS